MKMATLRRKVHHACCFIGGRLSIKVVFTGRASIYYNFGKRMSVWVLYVQCVTNKVDRASIGFIW
jgi:hypothetical protein